MNNNAVERINNLVDNASESFGDGNLLTRLANNLGKHRLAIIALATAATLGVSVMNPAEANPFGGNMGETRSMSQEEMSALGDSVSSLTAGASDKLSSAASWTKEKVSDGVDYTKDKYHDLNSEKTAQATPEEPESETKGMIHTAGEATGNVLGAAWGGITSFTDGVADGFKAKGKIQAEASPSGVDIKGSIKNYKSDKALPEVEEKSVSLASPKIGM